MKLECLEKLRYEWDMLEETALYLYAHRKDENLICCAILESFLIHVRIIYQFMKDKKDKGCLIASEFVDNKKSWDNKKKDIFANCGKNQKINGRKYKEGYYCLIHQHLAHLTETRIDFWPKWPVTDLYNECKEALEGFMECLGDDKKKYLRKSAKSVFLPIGEFTSIVKTSQSFSQALH